MLGEEPEQVTVVSTAHKRSVKRRKDPIGQHCSLKFEPVPPFVAREKGALGGQSLSEIFMPLHWAIRCTKSSIREHAHICKSSISGDASNFELESAHLRSPAQECIVVVHRWLKKVPKCSVEVHDKKILGSGNN